MNPTRPKELHGQDGAAGRHREFFIVGSPRSGTTLLQACLDRHPEIAVFGETRFMSRASALPTPPNQAQAVDDWENLLQAVIDAPEFADFRVQAKEFRNAAETQPRNSFGVLRALFEAVREATGKPVVGEKTPNHLRFAEALLEGFPDAVFIHLVRDPRAVVNSYRNVPWSSGTISADAATWRGWLQLSTALPTSVKDRMLVVRYEDLVAQPETELRKISSHLNVAFATEMLTASSGQRGINKQREPWKKNAASEISGKRASGWRQELTSWQVTIVEVICGDWLDTLGYERKVPRWLARLLAQGVRLRQAVSRNDNK